MTRKDQVLALLKTHKEGMTQKDITLAIYQGLQNTPNINKNLRTLIKEKQVIRFEVKNDTNTGKHFIYLPALDTQTITMSEDHAVSLIKDFFNEISKDEHCRYKSWEHCYKVFSDNRNTTDDQTVDYLTLHLGFYLASWGMYRGSTDVLQKDYKVHTPSVRIILEEKYNPLHGISAENLLKPENLDLLMDITSRLKDVYSKEYVVTKGKQAKASDTLVTKILLGTLGCVPAYDQFYSTSVKRHHVSKASYNSESVRCIARFYCQHFDVFEKLRLEISQQGIDYPPMKLMDMCFWQDGLIEMQNDKEEKDAAKAVAKAAKHLN